MKKLLVWVALLAAFHFPSFAQEGESSDGLKVNLGVACGFSFNEMNEVNLKNFMYRGSDEVLATYSSWYLEFISDFLPGREQISFSTGLRFTNRYAEVDKPWEHMFWLVNEEEKVSDYITLRSFSQRNCYLGIPLNFRVFFNTQERWVRPYLRLEGCFDFKVATVNRMDIYNNHMSHLYKERIEEELGEPKNLQISAASAIGVRINCRKFYVSPELVLPRFEMSDSPISFVDSNQLFVSAGMKISFTFPVGAGKKGDVTSVDTSYSSDIQKENIMPSEDF